MSKIKNEKVSNGYQVVSFDVKSLFTNVLLDRTIELVLKGFMKKMMFLQILLNRR